MRAKELFNKIWAKKILLIYIVPFVAMDLVIRVLFFNRRVFQIWWPTSWLFSILWIMLFGVIIYSFKGIARKIAYWILFTISFVFMLTNGIYYLKTDMFFNFSLLGMTSEGSDYIWDTIVNTNISLYIASIVVVILAVLVSLKIGVVNRIKLRTTIILFIAFIILHLLIPILTLHSNENDAKSKRSIYNDCTDANHSMEISGMYEYMTRGFYTTYIKQKGNLSKEDWKKLEQTYNHYESNKKNKYTGLFKGKNLIFLQLEGADDWALNKKDTPVLYKLKEQAIDFTDNYSMYIGGGSTFNSEFAANTGFVQPLSSNYYVCWYYYNKYKYTMPRYYKKLGYDVNAFHMNSDDFYKRGLNYKNWGYDNYYGLKTVGKYKDESYKLDRELVLNKVFNKNLFEHGKKKFVDYIVTYTPHMPWSMDNKSFQILAKEKYGNNKKDLSEEDFVKLALGETDNMVSLLIDELKKRNLYDDTVIVAYADHYLYTLNNKKTLEKHKETNNNLINHTPFFIWSSDIKSTKINKVTMQTNVLPTVLNLFGIKYDSNYFIGKDALDDGYDGFAFFPDYSWYDGKSYVRNKQVLMGDKMNKDELNKKSKKINELIERNDLTVKYNYFSSKQH